MKSAQLIPLAGFGGLLVFILWIIYMADTGKESIWFVWVEQIPGGDKLGHIWLYGCLAFLLNLTLRCRRLYMIGKPVFWGSALVLLFATLEEFTQAFFATRTFDFLDLLADIIGIYIAGILLTPKPQGLGISEKE